MVNARVAGFAVGLLASSVAVGASWRALMSPGPLSAGHASLENDCDACHLSFSGVPGEKCLGCHKDLQERVNDDRGFHARVKDKPCLECHTDHKGAKASQTKDTALVAFDHRQTGFELAGAHQGLACEKCHAKNKPLTQMAGGCGDCHKDPHAGRLGTDCRACHESQSWKQGLKTIAEHRISMQDGHQGLGCPDCHQGGRQLKKASTCKSCHEDKHGGTKAPCDVCHSVTGFKPAKFEHDTCTCAFPGKHQTFPCLSCHPAFKFTNTPMRCSGCHKKDLTHDFVGECGVCHSALSWKANNKFDHNKQTDFTLAGKHLEVDCTQCHREKNKRGKMKFKGSATTCEGCHAEQGRVAHGDFGACATCHTIEGFKPSSFDHAVTGFPLVGRHGALACLDCHQEKTRGYPASKPRHASLGEGARAVVASLGWGGLLGVFGPPAVSAAPTAAPAGKSHGGDPVCVHCHKDPHGEAIADTCGTCHTNDAFKPSTFDVARHADTAFPLTGQHQGTACSQCHIKRQLKGIPTDCAGCHIDRHGGRLGQDCAQCHDTRAFKPVTGFEHARTGFALAGAHAALPCASCHGESGERDLKAVQGAQSCQSCHTSRHADFAKGCLDCHAESDATFAAARARVDHRLTGFPLTRRHATVGCAGCHARGADPPLAECTACHADPHMGQLSGGVLAGGGLTTGDGCGGCHAPDNFARVRFDHDSTGFPLRGRHFTAPCLHCHANERWTFVVTDCADCHALDAARAGHPFSRQDCEQCHHSGWRW